MENSVFNIQVERAILSSIFFGTKESDFVLENLDCDDFFVPFHQSLLQTVQALKLEDTPIDEEFVKERLLQSKLFDESLFFEILTTTPSIYSQEYVGLLKDLRFKREILNFSNKLRHDILHLPVEQIKGLLQKQTTLFDRGKETFLTLHSVNDIEEKESEFICKDWLPIPTRTVSMITAPGGSGKSWLCLQLAIRFCMEHIDKKVFLWLSEDPKELSRYRARKISQEIVDISLSSIGDRLVVSDDPTFQILSQNQMKTTINPLFYRLRQLLADYSLIILDPLIAFFGGEENNNSHARQFMQLFTEWASREGKSIIFIHHSSKNTTQSRGASAFVDAVRLCYEIDRVRDKEGKELATNRRKIHLAKDNYGAKKYLNDYFVERDIFPPITEIQNFEIVRIRRDDF